MNPNTITEGFRKMIQCCKYLHEIYKVAEDLIWDQETMREIGVFYKNMKCVKVMFVWSVFKELFKFFNVERFKICFMNN